MSDNKPVAERLPLNPFVFLTSAGVIALFVLLAVIFTDEMRAGMGALQDFIVDTFGWFYILAVGGFLVFVLYLLLSPYGAIKLGRDDDEPDYSYLTWFAMLFSAGMGIGLLFYGVAEPIMHFGDPPGMEGGTVAAAQRAMEITVFHWGLHAWAIYIVVGLALCYASYRHGLPLTIRSTLYPLLGDKVNGPIGQLVEILAIFGTLFGVATSLGVGVQQINAGLEYLGLIDISTLNQVLLIAGITTAATVSVVSGLDVGIRRLSEANLVLGAVLLLFVFIAGPTLFLLSAMVENTGRYLQTVVEATFRTMPYEDSEWQKNWTLFYWGWWISWSPFVGMFIARISRGRTIREFIAGVLLVPSALGIVWFTVFGETAIHRELYGQGGIVEAVSGEMATAVFVMLEGLPWGSISTVVATLLVATFFVTSSDSGSLVIDILSTDGNPDPPVASRVFWAVTEGVVAALLLVLGGLTALQTAAITTALPFTVIMVFICIALYRGLRAERHRAGMAGAPRERRALEAMSEEEDTQHVEEHWRERVAALLGRRREVRPNPRLKEARERVEEFINNLAAPTLEEVGRELKRQGRDVELERHRYQVTLYVYNEGDEEFYYTIRGRAYLGMRAAFPEIDTTRGGAVRPRAEVVLRAGYGGSYRLEEFTREGIIADFLSEYAKWIGW
jgi:choline/glycine/proline betaine transport protein